MRIRTTSVALAAVVAFALTGCSSGGDSKGVDEPGVTSTTAAGVAAKTTTTDAASVMVKLAAAVPTASKTVQYTEGDDPNGKLGRPHQYTSKIQFADSRVDQAKAKEDSNGDRTDISYGGTVEVFANDADAKAWIKYVDSIGQAIGGLVTPDYLLRHGRVVLRVSHLLTTAQVGEYKAVLAQLG